MVLDRPWIARSIVRNVPTARVTLIRTSGVVSVVRQQEPGELPLWTIHVRGERPIYVALSLRDADRVSDYWIGATA